MTREKTQEEWLESSEFERQKNELELIASENYVSKKVLSAYSSVFTNKYSEGYPLQRYYGGQKFVDKLELLTQRNALKIFDLINEELENIENENFSKSTKEKLTKNQRGVNVQPLSGTTANLAVYLGLLKKGDVILGMDLSSGGHLSHGHQLNASGIYYTFVPYGLIKETLEINYEEIKEKTLEHKPNMILAGFSAYPKSIDRKKINEIAILCEEKHGYRPILMADIAHTAGLIASKSIEGPFSYFDIVTTTTHKTLRGPRGAMIYFKKFDNIEHQTLKRNQLEYDIEKCINKGVFPGMQGGPHMHVIMSKLVALKEVQEPEFKEYGRKIIENAKTLSKGLNNLGRNIIGGGTENHIILIDVTKKNINNQREEINMDGKKAEKVLEEIGISTNKNMIPFDKKTPLNPSGLRIGTPAITTRGLGKEEMMLLAGIIDEALTGDGSEEKIEYLKQKVKNLCLKFPLSY